MRANRGIDLAGATVLVTGASTGIGEAVARHAARAGAKVALAARRADRLEALAGELGGSAHPVDLADPAQLDGFVARVEAVVGPIDVLVNNAGLETSGLIEQADEARIAELVAVNLVAPQRLVRQVLPGMLARRRGHLVAMSSLAGVAAVPGASVYSSTKAGLSHFMACVTRDLVGTPVGTTLVEPGPVVSEMWERFSADPSLAAALGRAAKLQLLRPTTIDIVAAATVRAVADGRRHVRLPRRLTAQYALENAPRRLTDLTMVGLRPRR